MTFAVLFELIPSDVSFFYHTLSHICVPPWALLAPPLLVPKFLCCLSRLSGRHSLPGGCSGAAACLWHRVISTAGRNRCTLILPSNGNTHLAPSQRTGMKNLFSSHFFGDWLTVLWHSTLWLFVRSLVLGRLRLISGKSQRGPPCGTMNYSSAFCRMEVRENGVSLSSLLQHPEDTLLHIWGVQQQGLTAGEKEQHWRGALIFGFWDDLK